MKNKLLLYVITIINVQSFIIEHTSLCTLSRFFLIRFYL